MGKPRPGSPGLSGTESRISTTLTMNRIEKRIPAIAPARGAFNPAPMESFSSFIVPPQGQLRDFAPAKVLVELAVSIIKTARTMGRLRTACRLVRLYALPVHVSAKFKKIHASGPNAKKLARLN